MRFFFFKFDLRPRLPRLGRIEWGFILLSLLPSPISKIVNIENRTLFRVRVI